MRSLGFLVCSLFLIGFIHSSLQAKNAASAKSYYTAGVVEFEPATYHGSFYDQLEENLREYIAIINSNEAKTTDIIVFPELALNSLDYMTYVPDPKYKTIPCNDKTYHYESFFQKLSCAARYSRKYIVVNVLEKELCSLASQTEKNDPRPCPVKGINKFNTNVVFDREGTVIARYRKFNSYDLLTNVTYLPELSTFDTDFGVKFGVFICFDINFYSPVKNLVDEGVTDFVFSSFWFSELPFLTGVQLQQSWAYANNVNLLAAGASIPSRGTTGSGIFSGRHGSLVSVMARRPERKLYVANVTKASHWANSESFISRTERRPLEDKSSGGIKLMREYLMEAFTSELIDVEQREIVEKRLCHGSFCCQFNLKLSKTSPSGSGSSSYKYHMGAYEGDRKYSGFGYTKFKFCSVYACTGVTLDTCAKVFDDNINVEPEIVFEKIEIEADFPKAEKLMIMPSNLDQNLYPLSTDRFEFEVKDEKKTQHVRYTLSSTSDDLLTFGIYANYYDSEDIE